MSTTAIVDPVAIIVDEPEGRGLRIALVWTRVEFSDGLVSLAGWFIGYVGGGEYREGIFRLDPDASGAYTCFRSALDYSTNVGGWETFARLDTETGEVEFDRSYGGDGISEDYPGWVEEALKEGYEDPHWLDFDDEEQTFVVNEDCRPTMKHAQLPSSSEFWFVGSPDGEWVSEVERKGDTWTFGPHAETIREEWIAIHKFLPTTWRFRK